MGCDLDEQVPYSRRPWHDGSDGPHPYELIGLCNTLCATLHDHAPSPTILLINFINLERDLGWAD
jgi:hypothetical protein